MRVSTSINANATETITFSPGINYKHRDFSKRPINLFINRFHSRLNLGREPFGFECAFLVPRKQRPAMPAHSQFETVNFFNR